MKLPARDLARLAAGLLLTVALAACGKDEPNRRVLIRKWEGTRLTREMDGQPAAIGTFQPSDCTIEYFEDGNYRVGSRGAPSFGGDEAAT